MAKQCAVKKKVVREGKEVFICDETKARLLPVLQQVQDKKGYIPDSDMQEIADRLGIHPVEVYSVITFYSFLNTRKKGKYIIRVSNCVSSIMAGSERILKEFEKALKIKVGETTEDKRVTLERTSCIGMCDQAPAIMIDEELIGNVTSQKVKTILKNLSKKKKV